MSFLIDSDWIIVAFSDKGAARDVLDALPERGQAISVLTFGEVYSGFVSFPDADQNTRGFRRVKVLFDVLGLSEPILLLFAEIWMTLRREGRPLGVIDILIPAMAIMHDRVLMTRNVRHFERIDGLGLYSVNGR